ncbi:MAG: hypothetical protein R6V10_12985 [bacterium]
MKKRNHSRSRPVMTLAAVAALTLAFLVLLRLFPHELGSTAEYEWPVLFHGELSRLPAAVLITLLCAGVLAFPATESHALLRKKAGRLRLLAALFLLGAGLQLGPAAVHEQGLLEYPLRVYLPGHTSYFADAARVEDAEKWLDDFLPRFEKLSAILEEVKARQASGNEVKELWQKADRILHTHSRTHPPGAVMAFYAAQELARSSPGFTGYYLNSAPRSREAAQRFGLDAAEVAAGGVSAFVLFLLAAGCVPLAFAIARLVLKEEQALLAAGLFATAPAFSHKTPVLDHALAFFILLCLWLFMSGLFTGKWWKPVIAGIIAGLALWIGTSVVALFPLCALFAAAWFVKSGRQENHGTGISGKKAGVNALSAFFILSAVAAAVCLGLGIVLDLSYIKVYQAVSRTGWNLNNLASNRENVPLWMVFNVYEMLAFAGVPMAFFFLASTGKSITDVFKKRGSETAPWVLAIIVFLLALDLSGKVCYEASRLAWFGFPLMAIAAAQLIPAQTEDTNGNNRRTMTLFIAALLALQAACAITFRMIY